MEEVRFRTVGDSGLMVEFEQRISPEINGRVMSLAQKLEENQLPGILEWIPAFCSLLVCFDPLRWSAEELEKRLKGLLAAGTGENDEIMRIVEIPVCYGRYFGPDLRNVAEHAGLSASEVIKAHCAVDYRIYMLGFLPGFAYLGGLSETLHTPRLRTPRKRIPAGSVGIGGEQTGIYPLDSPGGWQLIGRTPVRIYDSQRQEPFLYQAGDYIRFVPIEPDTYYELHRLCEAGKWQPPSHTRRKGDGKE